MQDDYGQYLRETKFFFKIKLMKRQGTRDDYGQYLRETKFF